MSLAKRLNEMTRSQRSSYLGGSFRMTVDMRRFFFDRDIVHDPALEEARQGLMRVGSYVRRVARSSIKVKGSARKSPKKGSKAYAKWLDEQFNKPRSEPGKPPFQHTGNPVVYPRNIWFAKDGDDAVVVGMAAFKNFNDPVPHSIEFGESGAFKNPRRIVRKMGKSGEIRVGGNKARSTKVAPRTMQGSVAVTYAILRTQAQVDRANRINEELYGPLQIGGKTDPRPVMGPALDMGVQKFHDAFTGRLSGA